jgi:hypothetical protein
MEEKDLCYICLDHKGTLVAPCTQCNALVHKKCIQEQLDRKNYTCGACQKRFETENKRKVNYHDCRGGFGYIVLMIILTITNWIGMPLLYFGTTVTDFDSMALASFLLLLPVIITISTSQFPCCGQWYWTDPCWRWYTVCCANNGCCCVNHHYNGWNKKKYVIQSIMAVVLEIVLVVVSHLIGNPILIWLYDIDEWFTWRTSLAGLVACYIVVGILMILYFGLCCPLCCLLDHYSEDRVVIKNLKKTKKKKVIDV